MDMDFSALGRWLVLSGLMLAVLGGVLLLAGKIPFLGRLPGDFYIKRDHFTFYFPFVTCLAISVVLSLLFRLIGRK